jgi:hypothetical protein
MNADIDFVLLWVDMNDPKWRKKFDQYHLSADKEKTDTRAIKYRDWDNLRYWFRGVEKFASWVRKIHFVTSDQCPIWLNRNMPKLHIVSDSDYIPTEYLPLFNCNPLEINFHRIEGLAEQFVYFNDDMFLINCVKPEHFFRNGLPIDMAVFNALAPSENIQSAYIICNSLSILNRHLNKRDVLKKNFFKWFNIKYKKFLFRNMALLPWPRFTGFVDPHHPSSFLKSTYIKIWSLEDERLRRVCTHRFRDISDINQYLFRYWQLVEGTFYPQNIFKYFEYKNIANVDEAVQLIKNQSKPIICLNDAELSNFESAKKVIQLAFECILSNKSSFEL